MKKTTIHKKLSVKEILKRHKTNPKDKELHKVIETDEKEENDTEEKFNSFLRRVAKPSKSER